MVAPDPAVFSDEILAAQPHRRRNPLTGEWVLVSPQRSTRPWLGHIEPRPASSSCTYDPACYLCPGNARANGARNPEYPGTFVFDNDFPALLPEPAASRPSNRGTELFQSEVQAGACRVLCFSPRHDLSLAGMPVHAVRDVVDLWALQTAELGRTYPWVQIFENKGEMMGSSNPHPHGQVWATASLPSQAVVEDCRQRDYRRRNDGGMLLDYAGAEARLRSRVVEESDDWLAVVPFWAEWPFETLLLPRFAAQRLPDLRSDQRASLAAALKRLLSRYDNLFGVPFPYSMGWHGAPYAGDQAGLEPEVDHWQLHCHFYPPLLRSSTIRKFQVGYEMLAEAQRDLTPERAAEVLRSASSGQATLPEDET